MKLFTLAIIAVVAGSSIAANLHRVCSPSNSIFPYTGYRIEIQFNNYLKPEFHLYMCKEGRLLLDITEPIISLAGQENEDNIPWTRRICNLAKTDCFRLARRKTFVARILPIYFPGTIVGGIFDNQDMPILPLVAENFWTNQWIETHGLLKWKYHFPIFYTPSVYDKKHPINNNNYKHKVQNNIWAKNIDPKEKYNLNDSRWVIRKIPDAMFLKVNKLTRLQGLSLLKTWGTECNKFNPLVRILLLLKVLSKELFFGLIHDLDKIYSKLY